MVVYRPGRDTGRVEQSHGRVRKGVMSMGESTRGGDGWRGRRTSGRRAVVPGKLAPKLIIYLEQVEEETGGAIPSSPTFCRFHGRGSWSGRSCRTPTSPRKRFRMKLSDSDRPERLLLAAAAVGVCPRDPPGGADGPESVTRRHGRALPDLRIPSAVATLPRSE